MSMIVNRRDVDFYLDEMFDLASLLASDRYSEHDRESVTAILDLCQNMAEEEFLPCAAEHDENEPVFEDGQAITPDSLAGIEVASNGSALGDAVETNSVITATF